MKKLITTIAFAFASIVLNAQEAKVLKGVNEAGDVASFELDCTKKFPVLAKGLRYNITRHEFKGPDMRNTYRIMLVMDGFYTNVLNSEMTISAVLTDGSVISKKETIESDGYFDGACTLTMNAIKGPVELSIKQITIHADKDVVYTVSEQNRVFFTKNLNNIITAK